MVFCYGKPSRLIQYAPTLVFFFRMILDTLGSAFEFGGKKTSAAVVTGIVLKSVDQFQENRHRHSTHP